MIEQLLGSKIHEIDQSNGISPGYPSYEIFVGGSTEKPTLEQIEIWQQALKSYVLKNHRGINPGSLDGLINYACQMGFSDITPPVGRGHGRVLGIDVSFKGSVILSIWSERKTKNLGVNLYHRYYYRRYPMKNYPNRQMNYHHEYQLGPTCHKHLKLYWQPLQLDQLHLHFHYLNQYQVLDLEKIFLSYFLLIYKQTTGLYNYRFIL